MSPGSPSDPQSESGARATITAEERVLHDAPGVIVSAFQAWHEPSIITRARDGLILHANPAFERASGRDRADLVGHTTVELDLFHYPGGREAVLAELFASGQVAPRPCSIGRPDGTRRGGTLSIGRFPHGGEDFLLVTMYQVTPDQVATEALLRSEQRYRQIFEGASDAIFILHRDRFVDCNQRALAMFRRDRTALIDLRPFDLSPPVQPGGRSSEEAAREHIEAAFVEGHHTFEWVHRRHDGEDFPAEITLAPIELPNGRHLLAIVRDVTERREAERERQRLQEQLLQSQKMESVGRLAGGVAHDFNNMLTPILGHAELLRGELEAGDPRHARAGEIVDAAERCRDLVQRLLAFARRQTVCLHALDLSEVTRGFERMLRHTLREDVRLVLDLDDAAPRVAADRGLIEQVIMNLAVNAQDAMPAGGTLTLLTRGEPGRVALEVRDTGRGMDEATRQRAFEPFFTTREHGSGLGLSIVFGIVEQLGGTIDLLSAPGLGTSFLMRFPCADAVEAPEPVAVARAAAEGPHGAVLVVEDEPQVRALAVEVLSRAGHQVMAAPDAEQALARARACPGGIDLLLTDVVLPDRHGPDLYDELARERPGLRVLYMSGYADDVLGMVGPGTAFLQKPFAVRTLADRVAEVLSRCP